MARAQHTTDAGRPLEPPENKRVRGIFIRIDQWKFVWRLFRWFFVGGFGAVVSVATWHDQLAWLFGTIAMWLGATR